MNDEQEKLPAVISAASAIPSLLRALVKRRDGGHSALRSPFASFNNLVPGFFGGDLVIVAGRPSMGKTALAGSLAVQFASNGRSVLFFSLEMSASQILGRLLSPLTGIAPHLIQSGGLSDEQCASIFELRNSHKTLLENFFIVDSSYITAQSMETIASGWAKEQGERAGAIFVDYLQLMSMGGGSEHREKDVAAASASAKRLARELDLPVFMLSQLNRGVEMRGNKRPMLSDLRESGAIEQDADIVVMLYREDYYGLKDSVEGETELIIAKHRNGPTGTCRVWFDKERATFSEG